MLFTNLRPLINVSKFVINLKQADALVITRKISRSVNIFYQPMWLMTVFIQTGYVCIKRFLPNIFQNESSIFGSKKI